MAYKYLLSPKEIVNLPKFFTNWNFIFRRIGVDEPANVRVIIENPLQSNRTEIRVRLKLIRYKMIYWKDAQNFHNPLYSYMISSLKLQKVSKQYINASSLKYFTKIVNIWIMTNTGLFSKFIFIFQKIFGDWVFSKIIFWFCIDI